ncbi:hypothetical protein PTTG_09774 [Puccinia triticina 1-1 BBBD Race 1]|uniref:MULE transposase domain-containing protein n=1 Tax=Puccinia triticina (isolate 1-1 / race 1 (BBBD)) TaxID=630390 RepID=A0A0C4F9A4_PUCT1|nr:hypothetical protein PTTG_09774 [Puccinia triticina 1-1 BBBD Race 1]
MSDCALAIENGATAAYADLGAQAPKIYWCVFHVLKAFKGKAISYLQDTSEDAITEFRNVLYEQRVCPEILLGQLYVKWSRINPAFVRYVQIQWHTNVTHWAMYSSSKKACVSGPAILPPELDFNFSHIPPGSGGALDSKFDKQSNGATLQS